MVRRPRGDVVFVGVSVPSFLPCPLSPATSVRPIGLYVHVPFCAAICRYCHFNRRLRDRALESRFVGAVVAEIGRVGTDLASGREPIAADTLFLGGGTPSLLAPRAVGAIVDSCRSAFRLAPDAEVTIEANPETVTASSLAAFRERGVTRISFGVQSFRDDELARLGRIHTSARARQAVADARSAGFDNINIDLMMWLPGQTIGNWDESVAELIELAPEHASLYILELDSDAPLRAEMARTGWAQASDDDAATMYERGMDAIGAAGLRQYEISNAARRTFESRHNVKYWTDGNWCGFGPGAHSTYGGARWHNVPMVEEYLARMDAGLPVVTDHRVLTPDDRWREAVMMGMRLADGMSIADVQQRYGLDILTRYGDHLQPSFDAGLLEEKAGRLRLTRRGMLMANEVLAVFF
jgi:oxygen-independent coproporphyrinogen-3 oxidase